MKTCHIAEVRNDAPSAYAKPRSLDTNNGHIPGVYAHLLQLNKEAGGNDVTIAPPDFPHFSPIRGEDWTS